MRNSLLDSLIKQVVRLQKNLWDCRMHAHELPPVVKAFCVELCLCPVHACSKQLASLALYLAKRKPVAFPKRNVRGILMLHNCCSCRMYVAAVNFQLASPSPLPCAVHPCR